MPLTSFDLKCPRCRRRLKFELNVSSYDSDSAKTTCRFCGQSFDALWEETKSGLRWVLWLFGGIAVVCVGLGVYGLAQRQKRNAPFRHRLEEYVRLTEKASRDKRNTEPEYIRPKVVMLDSKRKGVDWLHPELPPKLRADTAGDVRTLVWVSRRRELVGYYHIKGKNPERKLAKAYRHVWDLVFIEATAPPEYLGKRSILGAHPPMETGAGGPEIEGDPPSAKEIVSYIAGLRVREVLPKDGREKDEKEKER